MGVVVRRYIDFLILLIPTPLVSVLFCSSMFFVHVPVLFVLKFCVIKTFSRSINTYTGDYGHSIAAI